MATRMFSSAFFLVQHCFPCWRRQKPSLPLLDMTIIFCLFPKSFHLPSGPGPGPRPSCRPTHCATELITLSSKPPETQTCLMQPVNPCVDVILVRNLLLTCPKHLLIWSCAPFDNNPRFSESMVSSLSKSTAKALTLAIKSATKTSDFHIFAFWVRFGVSFFHFGVRLRISPLEPCLNTHAFSAPVFVHLSHKSTSMNRFCLHLVALNRRI